MPKNDDYYTDDYYDDDYTFTKGYKVTSVDPGYELLAIAAGYSVLCFFVGFFLRCCCYGRRKTEQQSAETKGRGASSVVKQQKRSRSKGSNGASDDLLSNEGLVQSASTSGGGALNKDDFDSEELLSSSSISDFDFVFVGKVSNFTKPRNWHSRFRRAPSSRQKISAGSGSNRSIHSMSVKGSSSSHLSDDDNLSVNNRNNNSATKSGKRNSSPKQSSSSASYQQLEDDDGNGNNGTTNPQQLEQVTYMSELKNMFKLAVPWGFSSFVISTASIVTLGIISHYIGTAEMICYSYVWFIMEAAHLMSSALYTSLYKHVNNAAALGTEEGYTKAGKFIRIAVIFNFIISIPITFILIFSVGPIMALYGYGNKIINLSQKYILLASLSEFLSSSTGFASLVPDVEGHADFDAFYGLIDSGIDILIALFLVPWLQPSLLQLGFIHVIQDAVSIFVYYFITGHVLRWFDKYYNGIFQKLSFKINWCRIGRPDQFEGKDKNLVVTLISKTIPMTFDEFTGQVEWIVLSLFAAHLGAAEAASWVLISYIWGFVGIVPTNLASAFEYRVSNLLSNDNVALAKRMASTSVWMTTISSFLSCVVLLFSRNFIVDGVTNDKVLTEMLQEIIPFIILCDPLIAPSTAASYLNRALAMYRRSAKLELSLTVCITIPAAAVSAYVMNYNIEGLAAAAYAGYATMAVFIMYVYFNADWDRAVAKNKKMSGEYDIEETSITDTSSREGQSS